MKIRQKLILSFMGIALLVGVVGYFMRYYGYPLSPVMIALILGPIAEQNFCRALMISHGSFAIFFKSPIFDGFLALAIASLLVIGPLGGLVSLFILLRVEPLTALGLAS